MAEKIKVLIPEEKVAARVREMAEQISKDYEGEELHLVGILKGSVFMTCSIAQAVTVPVTMDFMSISSYGNETVSSGRVKILKDLDESIQGKNVLVIEDIIDSGRTLSYLVTMLMARNPKSLRLCTLLDKPVRREMEVQVDYTGFQIEDAFVVGCGLDYMQKYRNLPYVGVIEQ